MVKVLWLAGVATENIVDAYINAIKVLQCIDKSGVVLEAVTQPVKTYLRSRPDTIRCVVKMITQVSCPPTPHTHNTHGNSPHTALNFFYIFESGSLLNVRKRC